MTTLSELVDEYQLACRSNGHAKGTLRNSERVGRNFLAFVGNIQVKSVTTRHVDEYLAYRSTVGGLSPATLNLETTILRGLFQFAFQRRHLSAAAMDPVIHRRRLRVQPTGHLRIPASDFPRLLDSTPHPRDRIVLALGIYLLLRQSEIVDLRVEDVDLHHGHINVRIIKTAKFDQMPLSAELERELRAWLTFYTEKCGRLDPTWRLVPAKMTMPFELPGVYRDPLAVELRPTVPIAQPHKVVQRALASIGYLSRDSEDNPTRNGVHTLRRSAARAMFDRLCEDGYDGAGRVVQSLLHHSSFQQTEKYLGIELDQKRRDELIRGREMFPVDTSNVTTLRGNNVRHQRDAQSV